MQIERIEDMVAWQLAKRLEKRVLAFTDRPRVARDVDLCRQIRKSASSAPANMAEGFGRFWPAEFAHKMHIAIGELRETINHLETALEKKYITDDEHLQMFGLADRAIAKAVKFVEYLDAAGPDWKKEFLMRRREAYRAAHRSEQGRDDQVVVARTTNPDENSEPKNPNPNENPNENESENENPEL